MKMFRQGDVLLIRLDNDLQMLEKGRKDEIKPEVRGGRTEVVLAHGESTGHAHAIPAHAARLFAVGVGIALLRVEEETELRHEEHAPIPLKPGYYHVIRQREYTPSRPVFVAD
jgi:hypothetical protein